MAPAYASIARSVCGRAERRLLTLVNLSTKGFGRGDYPAENLNWDDGLIFLSRLSELLALLATIKKPRDGNNKGIVANNDLRQRRCEGVGGGQPVESAASGFGPFPAERLQWVGIRGFLGDSAISAPKGRQ